VKGIQYHRYGGPDVMRFEEFQPARPGHGEVLISVRAAAANPYDWKSATVSEAHDRPQVSARAGL
jgi:NADPH:quinone reductase-like Zn-dependent oxidoreductase